MNYEKTSDELREELMRKIQENGNNAQYLSEVALPGIVRHVSDQSDGDCN